VVEREVEQHGEGECEREALVFVIGSWVARLAEVDQRELRCDAEPEVGAGVRAGRVVRKLRLAPELAPEREARVDLEGVVPEVAVVPCDTDVDLGDRIEL